MLAFFSIEVDSFYGGFLFFSSQFLERPPNEGMKEEGTLHGAAKSVPRRPDPLPTFGCKKGTYSGPQRPRKTSIFEPNYVRRTGLAGWLAGWLAGDYRTSMDCANERMVGTHILTDRPASISKYRVFQHISRKDYLFSSREP